MPCGKSREYDPPHPKRCISLLTEECDSSFFRALKTPLMRVSALNLMDLDALDNESGLVEGALCAGEELMGDVDCCASEAATSASETVAAVAGSVQWPPAIRGSVVVMQSCPSAVAHQNDSNCSPER